MKKIVKYTTAQDNDSRGLDKRVTNLIDMGYQPYGAPYSAYNGRSVTLCQALVKYEGDEDAQPETPTRDTPAMQTPLKEAPSNAPKESPKLKSETSRLQIKPSAQPSIPPPPPFTVGESPSRCATSASPDRGSGTADHHRRTARLRPAGNSNPTALLPLPVCGAGIVDHSAVRMESHPRLSKGNDRRNLLQFPPFHLS